MKLYKYSSPLGKDFILSRACITGQHGRENTHVYIFRFGWLGFYISYHNNVRGRSQVGPTPGCQYGRQWCIDFFGWRLV